MRRIGERRFFAIGAALLALHVVDDGFVHPEPGTGAGDHLVSTGVPLLAVALAVVAYRSARPSVRAALSLVLGLVTIGIAAAVHAAQLAMGPFAGDHWTGLLLFPASLALLAAAWLARSEAPRRSRRRRAVLVLLWVGVGYAVVLPVVSAWFVTHKPRQESSLTIGAPATVRTSGGIRLSARYLPSRNRAAVVLLPGRAAEAKLLARHGFGVLLVEPRGNGGSEGDAGQGWRSAQDVEAAVDYLRARPDVDPERIGGLGFSLGGEIMLTAAGEGAQLHAVASEGAGFRSADDLLLVHDARTLSQAFSTAATFTIARVFSGARPPAPLHELVERIAPTPLLLMQAEHGLGGEERNAVYFEHAGQPKSYWLIKGSSHTGGLDARPAEYERRVVGFFDRALLRG